MPPLKVEMSADYTQNDHIVNFVLLSCCFVAPEYYSAFFLRRAWVSGYMPEEKTYTCSRKNKR